MTMNHARNAVMAFMILFAALIVGVIVHFISVVYHDRHQPDVECVCEFYQDYHQQHPTVLNKRCELDDKGFLMYGDTNVRVTKYVNICDNTNE
jgi:hypothetical protein